MARQYTLVCFIIILNACCCKFNQIKISPPEQYCSTYAGKNIIQPNYNNPDVKSAYNLLRVKIPKSSFYIDPETKKYIPSDSDRADMFLSSLCLQYSDNSEILKSKLKLIKEIKIVPEFAHQSFDPQSDPFSQLTAEGYRRLLHVTDSLDQYRTNSIKSTTLKPGRPSIAPISVCEMKYIFSEYLSKYRGINNYSQYLDYEKNLKSLISQNTLHRLCTADDLNTYYGFRGEGYLKPLSTESRIMDFTAKAVLAACSEKTSEINKMLSRKCNDYLQNPYHTRYKQNLNSARLMLNYPKELEMLMQMSGRPLFIINNWLIEKKDILLIPGPDRRQDAAKVFRHITDYHRFKRINETGSQNKNHAAGYISEILNRASGNPDKSGFISVSSEIIPTNTVLDPGVSKSSQIDLYERLVSLFDRHVFFYRTYMFYPALSVFREWASPWVSASYYPSQSNKFTFQGFASDKLVQPKMQWLYVFKFKKEDYYTVVDLLKGKKADYTSVWFNEINFTRHPYSIEELAVNFLGAIPPQQYSNLLYLGKIEAPAEIVAMIKTKNEAIAKEKSDKEYLWIQK